MPEQEQYVIEAFRFTSCQNWETDACSHIHNAYMQLSIINKATLFLFNDLATTELWDICSGCSEFKQK
jgi:hypothetical protein